MTTARSTAVAALSTLGWLDSSHSVAVEAAFVGSVPNAHACVASSASSVAEVLAIAVVVSPARKPGGAYRAAERCTPAGPRSAAVARHTRAARYCQTTVGTLHFLRHSAR
jgi:hypothetical protein